jgi:serine/threonine protein kinase
MPMLVFSPQKRISAQKLLEHPWLSMPANFDYTMNEKEYQTMMMIKKSTKKEKVDDISKVDTVESDTELNMADDEDNDEFNTADEFEQFTDEEDGDCDPQETQFDIPNYNNSFAAYGQYVSLSSLDRANPQFENLYK